MKRVVAFLLLAAMLLVALCSCSVDMEDTGSIIPMYISSPQTNLDPTRMVYDKDFFKVAGLIFSPLTNVTSSGKIENTLIESYEEKYNEERGEYFLYLNLVFSRWNDGRTFTADHVIYAWKKILSPETASPAAALLYDIKNAKAVKSGLMTVDDLGVAAVDIDTVEIQFEKPIDVELFFETISSPSLVPLRDDAIMKKEDVWATDVNDIASNGQFAIKAIDPAGEYRLDFSKYYRLPVEPEDGYNVYVKPQSLVTDFSKTPEEAINSFNNGDIYYVGSFTKDTYQANEKDIETSESLSTYTYFFDCSDSVLSNAKVRKALSLALNREEIAAIIGMGSQAATGFVPSSSTGSTMKKSFRDEAGNRYSTTADVAAAQSLLNEAGVKKGSFTITYRSDRAYDKLVAEYAKGVWASLGFTVSLKGLDAAKYETALYNGDFDVIGLDYQSLSTNPYSTLAPFAPEYSGSVVSVDASSSGIAPHVTRYNSAEYTKLLNEILTLTNRKERNAKLIELEKIFTEDCPAIALTSYVNSYLASDELKGLETSVYGFTLFTDAKLNDYKEKNEAYLAKLEEQGK